MSDRKPQAQGEDVHDGPLQENLPVWDGQRRGHYEVWYLHFNLVPEQLAFWLRYTLLAPRDPEGEPRLELWGVAFDARQPTHHEAWRRSSPFVPGMLGRGEGDEPLLRLGGGELGAVGCDGLLGDGGDDPAGGGLSWQLRFSDASSPLHHLPHPWLYRLPWPRTKLLAPRPTLRLSGTVRWRGVVHALDGVLAQQAHLWGSGHAASWAWASCIDFPTAPGALLELLSARLPVGRHLTPPLTLAVLRLDGKEYRFDRPGYWLFQRSRADLDGWQLRVTSPSHRLEVSLTSRPAQMVAVTYRDPDGSTRVCHNTGLADLTVDLYRRAWGLWWHQRRLESAGRTAFELGGPVADPRVRLLLR